jgi:hypothetical protein
LVDVVASSTNVNNELLQPDTTESMEGYIRVYSFFLTAGMVPPLSACMVSILAEYDLLLTHIHPNGLL